MDAWLWEPLHMLSSLQHQLQTYSSYALFLDRIVTKDRSSSLSRCLPKYPPENECRQSGLLYRDMCCPRINPDDPGDQLWALLRDLPPTGSGIQMHKETRIPHHPAHLDHCPLVHRSNDLDHGTSGNVKPHFHLNLSLSLSPDTWSFQEAEYLDGSIVPVCVNTLQNGWHPIYYIVVFVLFFVIPSIILLILYAMISKKLTSDSKSIPNSSNFKRRHQIRRQVVLMLASVCITFFICLLPFRLMTLWIIMSTQEEVVKIGMETYYTLLFICRLLLYVNSSINPILYNLISCKFRAAFCRILKVDLRSQMVKNSIQAKDSCISERFSNTMDRTPTGNNTVAYPTTIITTRQNNNTMTISMKQHSFRSAAPVDVHSLWQDTTTREYKSNAPLAKWWCKVTIDEKSTHRHLFFPEQLSRLKNRIKFLVTNWIDE